MFILIFQDDFEQKLPEETPKGFFESN